jgi:ribosomal-protein-alanine N-acetyltransferase
MNIHIETDRLILRDIEETDAEGIFALDSDPRVHTYLGTRPIESLEEARGIIQYIRQQYVRNGIGRWAIIDKKSNDFIGWTGLKYEQQVRSEFGYYDIGYRLRTQYWGQGIATETARECLNYGFEKMNLNEICGAADVRHQASNHILQKIGLKFSEQFEFEGTLANFYRMDRTRWEQNKQGK